MGNSITKDLNDHRFNEKSLLGIEIKKIMMDYDKPIDPYNPTYTNVKQYLAKACCKDVIRPGVSNEKNSVASIAFPIAGDLTQDRCKKDGVCLETEYVGLQIDDERVKYCGKGDTIGLAGYNFSIDRDSSGNSECDNYMLDYCAKSIYDQGCITINKNKTGKLVSQFTDPKINPMCLDKDKRVNYGPPECECLNSIFGTNLNTRPAKKIGDSTGNPYGLEGTATDPENNFSKYSLNIFNQQAGTQRPRSLDNRCTVAATRGDSGRSSAYTLLIDKLGQVTICLNQINLNDSNIGNANISDLKQENNCGGGALPPAKNDLDVEINKDMIEEGKAKLATELAEKAKADKAKADKAKADAEAAKLKPSATSTPATSTPATSTPATSTPTTSTPATSTPATSTPSTSTPATSTPATDASAASAAIAAQQKADANARNDAKAKIDAIAAQQKVDADAIAAQQKVDADAAGTRNKIIIGVSILVVVIVIITVIIIVVISSSNSQKQQYQSIQMQPMQQYQQQYRR